MDEIARQIGWLVIIVGAVYVVGKLVIAHSREQDTQRNKTIHQAGFVRRLAYRKVYRSTTDTALHAEIKNHYPSWFDLYLDLDDAQYRQQTMNEPASADFQKALKEVAERGDFCKLIDGKLVYRPAQGWQATDASQVTPSK